MRIFLFLSYSFGIETMYVHPLQFPRKLYPIPGVCKTRTGYLRMADADGKMRIEKCGWKKKNAESKKSKKKKKTRNADNNKKKRINKQTNN